MKCKLNFFLLIIVLMTGISITFAQEKERKGLFAGFPEELTLSGYVDTYIAYDNDKGNPVRQFSAIAPYRDEFRINLAMIALRYSSKLIRSNVAIQFGDIPKLNWPQAPNEYLQYIQEANIGVSPGKNSWVDAGYFLTHIGGEGLIPKYNFFTSLTLCTYYEPFYQSGIKYSYTGKKFYTSLMVLNGFNVLADNNKNKSFGLQIGYKPNDKADITFNNITGNEMPTGTAGKTRIYNNLVIKLFPSKKLDVILCGDFCMQEKSKIDDAEASGSMFSAFASMKYRASKNVSLMLRGEIFQDKDAIMSPAFLLSDSTFSGLKAFGVTGGAEFNPTSNSYFRLEGRYLATDADEKIFYEQKNNRLEVILSGGIEF
ncbi:MAG: porin [Ignavibacteria bacterium]|nr:porin [Ignavibacteria bacterium]